MIKRLIAVAMFCASATAQVAVSPIVQPHVTFVDASGAPCAGCTLNTYVAGTTTPLATFTDAGGVSTNFNPIVLDAAGGANIWLSGNSYKFILKTAGGVTIWSVDQVKGGGGVGGICGPAGTIQIANSAVNGLTCDSTITINTSTHTINVGTLPTNHVTIGAVSTPTSWVFDTTSAATALASLGGGSVTSVALTLPDWLAVTGSPITTSGTLAVVPQPGLTANQFLATPDGTTGSVGRRSIVPGDLPVGTPSAFGAFKCDNVSITCVAGVLAATGAAATCNTNGCYITLTGGTIIQWGAAGSCGGGTFSCNVSVTFPTAFSSTTNLSLSATAVGAANNTIATAGSPSTTTFNVQYAALVYVGGSGSNLSGSQTATWVAIGK